MENQNKYLLLARRAREENNVEDAKKYYDIVRTEEPDNVEAKFFYSYYRMLGCKQGQAADEFITFCNSINSTVSLLLASDYTKLEKLEFIKDIYDCIMTAFRVANNSNKNINGTRGGDIFNAVRTTAPNLFSKIKKECADDSDMLKLEVLLRSSYLTSLEDLLLKKNLCEERFALGDDIEKLFASDSELMMHAVKHWKAAVADGQRWPGVVEDKTKLASYAEKIKKYDPGYVMPEAAKSQGCIQYGK